MRAREFVSEGKTRGHRAQANHEFDMANPGMIGPGGNGDTYWGRYYDFYRVSTLAGMDPDDLDDIDTISFFGNLPAFCAYTEADRQKLKKIMKKLGMKPRETVGAGSCETNGTNSVSPVKPFRGYPR
jgi:hypothetical protein